jgi:hypothetical protein
MVYSYSGIPQRTEKEQAMAICDNMAESHKDTTEAEKSEGPYCVALVPGVKRSTSIPAHTYLCCQRQHSEDSWRDGTEGKKGVPRVLVINVLL